MALRTLGKVPLICAFPESSLRRLRHSRKWEQHRLRPRMWKGIMCPGVPGGPMRHVWAGWLVQKQSLDQEWVLRQWMMDSLPGLAEAPYPLPRGPLSPLMLMS